MALFQVASKILIKLSKNQSISDNDLNDIQKLYDEIIKFSGERNFSNNLDLEYLKKEIAKL